MPGVSVSDHGVVAAHLSLGQECAKRGISPYFAEEFYHGIVTEFKGQQRDQAHLIVGAYDDAGLKNLWRLSDKSASNFRFVPRVNWDMLKEFREGLWATSACIAGLVSRGIQDGDNSALNQYLDVFGENFFIEIHTYPSEDQKILNQALVQIARERGLPLIWASDAHHAGPEDYPDHDVYLIMQMGEKIDTPIEDRKMWHPNSLYIKSEDEVRADLAYLGESVVDECIRNSWDLSQKCTARLPEVKRHLPVFIPSDSKLVAKEHQDKSAADLLTALVVEGAYERYGEPSEEVWARLQTELGVLIDAHLEDYLLHVWEICTFADKEGIIRGPSRGSSASSLVCYVLKITDIDSLKYGLYFERFYNIGREKGLPDIDIDFSAEGRNKIKAFVSKRMGADKVENIGTVMRLKPIAALNKTWSAFNIDPKEFGTIRKIVGKTHDIDILGADSIGWAHDDTGRTVYVLDDVGDEIEQYVQSLPMERQEAVNKWLDFVSRLVGRVSGYGIHPSGVVVSDTPISEELPRMWSASSKTFATQFPMDDVAKRQFLKDDLLVIRNLDTLEDWTQQMKDQGVDIQWSGLQDQEHPDDMWQILDNGLGIGIFQIEDSGFPLELCKRMAPRNIVDLSLIVALDRPGPIRAKTHERFIARRFGQEEITYDDPFLEDVLKENLGQFVFQEDVIGFFAKLGYTAQEADGVRSLLGKKLPEEQRRLYRGDGQWKNRGYLQMAEKAGLGHAQMIWDQIEGFSRYSFNKCLTGDTVICRGGGGGRNRQSPEITLEELFQAQESDTPWGQKIRNPNRGISLTQMDDDGRIRLGKMKCIVDNGVQPVWRIITSGGQSIKATANHRLLTEEGYVEVQRLSIGQSLIVQGIKEPPSNQHITGRGRGHIKGTNYSGMGFPLGIDNPGWLDGRSIQKYKSLEIVKIRAGNRCETCHEEIAVTSAHAMECAHIMTLEQCHGDYLRFHSSDNIKWLCNSCHKKLDYAKGERKKRWTRGIPTVADKIVSIEYVGMERTYDVEMLTSQHNFIANGIVSHNSHAVSYAVIAFRTLFAKYWAPQEFILACIRTNPDDQHKYIAEGRRLGISIRAPHIAHSETKIVNKDGVIYLGFSEIKGLSPSSSKYLLHLRNKYGRQIYDPEVLKERLEAENKVWTNTNPNFRSKVSPKTVFKMNQIDLLVELGAFDDYIERPISDSDRNSIEKRLLGIVVTQNSEDVFARYQDRIEKCDSWDDLDNLTKVTLPCTITEIKATQTKANNEDMAIITAEYRGKICKVAVFPRQYQTYRYLLNEQQPAIIKIKATERGYALETASKLV